MNYMLKGIPRETWARVKYVATMRETTIKDILMDFLSNIAEEVPAIINQKEDPKEGEN